MWQLWKSEQILESPLGEFPVVAEQSTTYWGPITAETVLASVWRAQVCRQALPAGPPGGLLSLLPALPTLALPGLRERLSLRLRHVASRVSGSSLCLLIRAPVALCQGPTTPV